jgi:hypothetical protein
MNIINLKKKYDTLNSELKKKLCLKVKQKKIIRLIK